METKKSICRSAIFKKTGTGSYGEYHVYEVTFDNGDKGNYLAKKNPQDVFKEGQEAEYTIEKKENGQYVNYQVKPVQQVNGFPKGNPVYEHKRTALKCSVELACSGKINLPDIGKYADSFMKFLQT